MKTISRITLMLGLLVAIFSTNSFAQSALTELQSLETTLNADIATMQTSITDQQNLLSTVDADLLAATNEGDYDAEQAFIERQTMLNASIADLQASLAQLQADLAAVQAKIPVVQNEENMLDKNWVAANIPVTPTPEPPRILTVPDANNPSTLNVIFGTTGDPAQDEQILRSWLYQYGLIDAE